MKPTPHLTPTRCTCGHTVMVGVDDTRTIACTWPVATTTVGELAALARGAATWHRAFNYGWLRRRTPARIAALPAHRIVVLVEHRCTDPPPPPRQPEPLAPLFADPDPPF